MDNQQHIYIDNSYTNQDIKKIQEKESDTLVYPNFLSLDELSVLRNCIDDVAYPEVGKTSKYAGASYNDPPYGSIVKEIIDDKLQNWIGPHQLDFFAWQEAIIPWKIHADIRWYKNKLPHKVILIPLDVISNSEEQPEKWQETFTLTFKQRSYLRNNKNTDKGEAGNTDQVKWKSPIQNRNYENFISGYSINKETHQEYMNHMPYEFLEGLELDTIFEWVPGNAVCWDQTQLHCADNFLARDIKTKLSLLIFTNQI